MTTDQERITSCSEESSGAPDYVILAHDRVDALVRLLHRVKTPTNRVFLHFNERSSDVDFERVQQSAPAGIEYLTRRPAGWGHWNLVAATNEALRLHVKASPRSTHIVRLSGVDYPVASPAEIASFFECNRGNSFVECAPFPTTFWPNEAGGYARVDRWHSQSSLRAFPPTWLVAPGRGPRRVPVGLRPYGGWPFWVLSSEAAEWIVAFLDRYPALERFFRTTRFAEETFVQTLVMHSPFAASVRPGVHFMDWSAGASGPKELGLEDIPRMLASKKMFARKIPDAAVMEQLDAALAG